MEQDAREAVVRLRVMAGGVEFEADGRRELTIGRDPAADVCTSDERTSRHHARARLGLTGWELEDTGSTNGTWCEGRRVTFLAINGPLRVRLGNPDDGEIVDLEPLDHAATGTVIDRPARAIAPPPPGPGRMSSINRLVHDLGPRRPRDRDER